ncbi:MAG: hypothetical protein ACYCTL_08320 [Acidimicrobiales bacterium]
MNDSSRLSGELTVSRDQGASVPVSAAWPSEGSSGRIYRVMGSVTRARVGSRLLAGMAVVAMVTGLTASAASAASAAQVTSAAPFSTSQAGAVRATTTTPPPQLAYTSLVPSRIADTRCGGAAAPQSCAGESLPAANSGLTMLPAGGYITVAMPSTVPADAGAVVLNVAAVDQTGAGYLTVWPAGTTMPTASNVNFAPSQSRFGVANLVTTALGSSGGTPAVSIYDGPTTGGSVDVVVDLEGYYAPQVTTSATSGAFHAESPTRIADSRCTGSSPPSLCSSESLPSANSGFVTLGPGATDTLAVAGVGGVPSSGAEAAIMNFAVTDTTASSFLSVYPGSTRPEVSNLNWMAGETLSNNVVVGLSTSGTVTVYNNSGTANVVVDVEGWFSSSSSTSTGAGTGTGTGTGTLFTPLSPARMADTRCSSSSAPSSCASEHMPSSNMGLAAPRGGQSIGIGIAGNDGVPTSASAAVLNVTDVEPTSGNYLTVYPAGTSAPYASNVNWSPENPYDIVPNAVYAALGSGGAVDVLNGSGSGGITNVVVDLFGYFSVPSTTSTVTASPANLPAVSSAVSTVTTTLLGSGLPLAGIPVVLTLVPSTPGSCGTLSPASGLTSSTGQLVSKYTASTTAGTCTITSLVDGLTGSTVITQTAGSALGSNDTVALLASPTSINVGLLDLLGGTSTITATVDSASGSPVPGDQVTFTASCGTVSPGSGTTNSSGEITTTYSAPAGLTVTTTCTVSATEAGTSQSASTTITILL